MEHFNAEAFASGAACAAPNQDFWANVAIGTPDACWPWLGRLSNSGHPHYRGNSVGHKLAFEAVNGPVPEGLEVCHNCGNAACCNPAHMRADTHKSNMADVGLNRRGKPARVLNEALVLLARVLKAAGRTIVSLAAEFGVRADTLGKAVAGKTWRHVPMPAALAG